MLVLLVLCPDKKLNYKTAIFLKIKTTKRSFTTVKVDAHRWHLSEVAASGWAATGIAVAMASIFNAEI